MSVKMEHVGQENEQQFQLNEEVRVIKKERPKKFEGKNKQYKIIYQINE
jgi:hypothetical protein